MKISRRMKIIFVLIIVICFIYTIVGMLQYSLDDKIKEMQNENRKINQEINTLKVQINTQNSREKIMETHPNIQMHNNVYYLNPIPNE